MNHTGQRSFIILESSRKYDYEVIKNIYTTGQSHIQKSSTSFNFLYLKAIIFIHADNVRNSLFKTRPFFSSSFFYLSSSSFSISSCLIFLSFCFLIFFTCLFSQFFFLLSFLCSLLSSSTSCCLCTRGEASLDLVKIKTSSCFIPP